MLTYRKGGGGGKLNEDFPQHQLPKTLKHYQLYDNLNPFGFILSFLLIKKHHFESLNNNEMVDSEVLVTKKS